jgi:hypothetical protein
MAIILSLPRIPRSCWYGSTRPSLLCLLVLISLAELVIGSVDLSLVDLPFLSVPLQHDSRFSNYQILLPRIVFENPKKRPNAFHSVYLKEATTVDSGALGIFVSRDLGLGFASVFDCTGLKHSIWCPCPTGNEGSVILDFGVANFTLAYEELVDADHREGGQCASRIAMHESPEVVMGLPSSKPIYWSTILYHLFQKNSLG